MVKTAALGVAATVGKKVWDRMTESADDKNLRLSKAATAMANAKAEELKAEELVRSLSGDSEGGTKRPADDPNPNVAKKPRPAFDDDSEDEGYDYSYFEFSDQAPDQAVEHKGQKLKKIYKKVDGKFKSEHPGCFELASGAFGSEGTAYLWGWMKPGMMYGATFYRDEGTPKPLMLDTPDT